MMSFSLTSPAIAGLFLSLLINMAVLPGFTSGQSPITCEEALPERLACYDTDGPCESLPLPAPAFGPIQPDPTKGYLIQTLRDSVDGNIYGISEGSYWMIAALAPLTMPSKKCDRPRQRYPKKKKKMMMGKGKGKGRGKDKDDDEDCEPLPDNAYEVVMIDFPTGNFEIYDATGTVVGSRITAALDEILFDFHGLTVDQIAAVKMVYSHQHMDHVGGGTIVRDHVVENWKPSKLDIIGTEEGAHDYEKRIEANFFSFRAPVPNIRVGKEDRSVKFAIGDSYEMSLEIISGHTDAEDLSVFIPKDEVSGEPAILMYVDVVFPGWAPFFSFGITTDVFHFLQAHEHLLEFDLGDDGIFVGGHLSKVGNREDIITSKAFADAVMAGALTGLQQVNFGAVAAASGVADPTNRNVGNSWLLFDLYFKEVVKVCAKEVVAEWGCKLGAVDVTIDSHCNSAQSYWRVDF